MLPLLGQIAAGAPMLAEEHVEELLAVPEMLTASGENFLLRVRGESMIDDGILDGDYVVVRRQDDCRATARSSPRSSTAARPPSSGSTARAIASGCSRPTPTMEPIYADDVDVLGRIVGVFRRIP